MTDLQIQYFLKVADCMSFSGAAHDLFVSQPSVSRQVHQLEQELGDKLAPVKTPFLSHRLAPFFATAFSISCESIRQR